MLLGQAESGKSTLQKQMQLYYSSQTLDKEKPSWKPIVFFNLLKALATTSRSPFDIIFTINPANDFLCL